ncbi:unnamed protein product [Ranitomeya imitator]|uniref:MGT5A-like N-terminal domain-containing protein n=1 Tax=Ranitomeya imitator TaxID=111125 RepID=A0ABN9MIR8_9NEOB|nr:unnamed protein product [Ranitomeya imitator]
MYLTFSRKTVSQKLSILLLAFGFIWGLMLLRYTIQYPRHQSSTELREQILDLSRRYVKALSEENKDIVNGGSGDSMAGYEINSVTTLRSVSMMIYFINLICIKHFASVISLQNAKVFQAICSIAWKTD